MPRSIRVHSPGMGGSLEKIFGVQALVMQAIFWHLSQAVLLQFVFVRSLVWVLRDVAGMPSPQEGRSGGTLTYSFLLLVLSVMLYTFTRTGMYSYMYICMYKYMYMHMYMYIYMYM